MEVVAKVGLIGGMEIGGEGEGRDHFSWEGGKKSYDFEIEGFRWEICFFFNGNPTNLLENQTETTKEQVQIDITEKRRTTNKSNKCQNKQTREKRRHHQG